MVNYKAEHLDQIVEQKATAYLRAYITPDHMRELEKSKMSYTGIVNGRVVFCAGVIEYWPGRGEAWTFIDGDCKKEFYAIHKIVKRFLEVCPVKRVEATVDVGFEQGHRWVKNLGFKLEAPVMKSYMPGGGDSSLYAKVRD